MTSSYLKLKDLRKEFELQKILPKEFWNAFTRADYPTKEYYTKYLDKMAFHIEKYANLVYRGNRGRGFICSLYRNNYIINILCVKNAFHISIFSSEYEKPIGIINYYPCSGKLKNKHEMQIYKIRTEVDNPIAKVLLDTIRMELFKKKIYIDTKVIKGGKLSFESPIKTIVTTILWRDLINFRTFLNILDSFGISILDASNNKFCLSPKDKAEFLSGIIKDKPSTIAGYGMYSNDPEVKKEANRAYMKIKEILSDITNIWKELKKNSSDNDTIELFDIISKKTGLKPSVVAFYAKSSDDKELVKIGQIYYNKILDCEHGITPMWRNLIENEPNLSSLDIAIKIGIEKNLDPVSVCDYARYSDDKKVKSHAINARPLLKELSFNIEGKILKIQNKNPEFSFEEIINIISKATDKSPINLCQFARASSNEAIKKKSNNLLNKLYEKKYKISQKWRRKRLGEIRIWPLEIAKKIKQNTHISLNRIIELATYSADPDIKFESIIAMSQLKKKGIFNNDFIELLKKVLKATNKIIEDNGNNIDTLTIRKSIDIHLNNFSLGSKISRCLIIIENLGYIKLINHRYPKQYSLLKDKIDINEFINTFKNPIDFRIMLKGIFRKNGI